MNAKFSSEKEYLEHQKELTPELFYQDDIIEDDKLLETIGIKNLKRSETIFWHKMFAPDFVVEESNSIHGQTDIDFEELKEPEESTDKRTLYVVLVKCNIQTIDVVKNIAGALGIEDSRIGYAGLKDKYAITSQTLSLRGVLFEDILKIKSEYFFLKKAKYSNGVIGLGDLKSNKFSITMRGKDGKPNGDQFSNIEKKYNEIKTLGFKNFYYLQRFSSPRYTNMQWGYLIFIGKYEEAVRLVITQKGRYEISFFKNIRDKLNAVYGDFEKMREILSPFESSFSTEKAIVDYLINNKNDYFGALASVKEQVKLWVYAVPSYYFNKKLSDTNQLEILKNNKLPLILSNNISDHLPYINYLTEDGIYPLKLSNVNRFSFILVKGRDVPAISKPDVYVLKKTDDGFLVSFSLSKGEYATTFLSHLVTLGQPGEKTKESYVPNFSHFSVPKLKTLEYFLEILN